MYKTAETGLETRARSARVSMVSKVLCIPVYTDTAWYKVFIPCSSCRCTRHVHAMAPRDSCILCPAGLGVLDTHHAHATCVRCFARDKYNRCPEATTHKACTNTHGLPGLVLQSYKPIKYSTLF